MSTQAKTLLKMCHQTGTNWRLCCYVAIGNRRPFCRSHHLVIQPEAEWTVKWLTYELLVTNHTYVWTSSFQCHYIT